jgi:hypothetical protein
VLCKKKLKIKELKGMISVAVREVYEFMYKNQVHTNVLDIVCTCSYIDTHASVALTDFNNGTAAVELSNRVFSALELVCYLFPKNGHTGACVLPILVQVHAVVWAYGRFVRVLSGNRKLYVRASNQKWSPFKNRSPKASDLPPHPHLDVYGDELLKSIPHF